MEALSSRRLFFFTFFWVKLEFFLRKDFDMSCLDNRYLHASCLDRTNACSHDSIQFQCSILVASLALSFMMKAATHCQGGEDKDGQRPHLSSSCSLSGKVAP